MARPLSVLCSVYNHHESDLFLTTNDQVDDFPAMSYLGRRAANQWSDDRVPPKTFQNFNLDDDQKDFLKLYHIDGDVSIENNDYSSVDTHNVSDKNEWIDNINMEYLIDNQKNKVVPASVYTQTVFTCNLCDEVEYNTQSKLNRHIRTHHNTPEKLFNCNICFKNLFDFKSFVQHVKETHASVKKYHCKYCEKCYDDFSKLMFHLKIKHNLVMIKSKPGRKIRESIAKLKPTADELTCHLCSRELSSLKSLKCHMEKHI